MVASRGVERGVLGGGGGGLCEREGGGRAAEKRVGVVMGCACVGVQGPQA
jgi:hypothetical protein